MINMYVLNPKTKTLHIVGGCWLANSPEYKRFESEEEAREKDGSRVHFCKHCEKKRDELLRNMM